MLESHANGICAYARFKLTTAQIEAGNIAIGMIRKRAPEDSSPDRRPEPPLALFPEARKLPHASA